MEGTPRCRDRDVDPNWWIEEDHDPAELDITAGHGNLYGTPAGEIVKAEHRKFMRAKMVCLAECPMLAHCRKAGWTERHHIWGGLTPTERFRARERGGVRLASRTVTTTGGPTRREVARRFRSGETTLDIAVSMGMKETKVMDHLTASIASLRSQRERGLPLWAKVPPRLTSSPTSAETYRRGRESSTPSVLISA